MLSDRLGTVNDFQRGFKTSLSYSKPHTFLIYFGGKDRKNAFTLSTGQINIHFYNIMP